MVRVSVRVRVSVGVRVSVSVREVPSRMLFTTNSACSRPESDCRKCTNAGGPG